MLWGGNLCVVNSLLGTPHLPRVKGGILFLEDVNEHPYRVERSLLQLHQAGVLDAQKAVLLGAFTDYAQVAARPRLHAQERDRAPARGDAHADPHRAAVRPCAHEGELAGRRKVELAVQGRDVFIGW